MNMWQKMMGVVAGLPAGRALGCLWLVAAAVCRPQPVSAAEPAAERVALERRLLSRADENIERVRKADATIRVQDTRGQLVVGAKVEVRQTRHQFLFGCIIFDLVREETPKDAELFKQRFRELFNFAVFPFYWARYEPAPGQTRLASLEPVVAWCRNNSITTKGHPLVWTNRAGVPPWVRRLPAAESRQRLLARVRREVGGLAGTIDIWDVVNEPVNCRTWDHTDARDYIQEPIDRIADYVDQAFRAAHQANPHAHLILNEFNTIARPEVRRRFYQLAAELKRRGTPLSGLGIQAHEPREHWYPPPDVWATFDRLASLGYPLHVTEFIPQSGGKQITGGWRTGRWTEGAQAEYAEQFYRLAFGHPAVQSINWWGLSDRRIWLPGGGLIDEQYRPKLVYQRLQRLIHQQWKTTLTLTTDREGIARFRGFLGQYQLRISRAGLRPQQFQATLQQDRPNRWVFRLAGK